MNRHSELLKEIVETKKASRYRFFELDLRDPLHRECVMSRFGGKDLLASRYPSLNSLLLETLANPPEIQGENPEGFCAAASVIDLAYDETNQFIYATGDMTPKGVAERLYVSMEVHEGNELIARSSSFCDKSEYTELKASSSPRPKSHSNSQVMYRVYVEAIWEPRGSNILRSMIAYSEYEGTLDDLVEKVYIIDPVHKVTPPNSPIVVSYSRDRPDVVDYRYDETRDANDNEKVYLDVNGYLKLKNNYTVFDACNIGAILKCPPFGAILYLGTHEYGDKKSDKVVVYPNNAEKTEIGWSLNVHWDTAIPDSVKFGDRCHDFEFSFDYRCEEDMKLHKLLVTSIEVPGGWDIPAHAEIISKIQLYWGCLTEDTEVTMADGSKLLISEIAEGCYVRTPDGGSARVREVIRGTEPTVYVLRMMNDLEVKATKSHPFRSEHDFISVAELNSHSSLMTDEGLSLVRYCYPTEYSGNVYNLELEGADSFFANGIVSGTNAIQALMENRSIEMLTEAQPNPVVQAETERLREDFANGLI